jgi:hypothetical protein
VVPEKSLKLDKLLVAVILAVVVVVVVVYGLRSAQINECKGGKKQEA